MATAGYALTGGGVQIGDLGGSGGWLAEELAGDVRVEATAVGRTPVFVGIARESDVDAYLAGVAHSEVDGIGDGGVSYEQRLGAQEPAAPTLQDFWVASAAGAGTRSVPGTSRRAAGAWWS